MQLSARISIVVACAAVMSMFTSTLDAALIGHWRLDEGTGTSAADASSLGNTANKVGGGGSWVTSGAPAGNAYDFPGGGGNYFVANVGAALPIGAAERTMIAWINPDQASQDRKFVGYGTSGAGNAFNFTVEGSGIRFRHGGGNVTYGGGDVTPNDWYHIAMRVNSGASLTGDVDVFINGVQAAVTGTASGGTGITLDTALGAGEFRIGSNFQNNSFDGSVDDVQLYDTALSDGDIVALFNNPGFSLNDLSGNVPVTILSTDFTGRTVAGATASTIAWVVNGVADPGDLTAVPVGGGTFGGLFDSANAQGHFAPDRNTGNEGPWSVDIPVLVEGSDVIVQDVVLDWQHFNNSGVFQGPSRSVDWTAALIGSLSGQVATITNLNVSGTSGIETLTFAAPVTLSGSETWTLQILAEGSNGTGNNTGLDGINVIGFVTEAAVPEPATATLALIGIAGLAMRRRRRAA